MTTAYCPTCSWQVHADNDVIADLNRAMIDHYIETGHPVERADSLEAIERLKRKPSMGRLECD